MGRILELKIFQAMFLGWEDWLMIWLGNTDRARLTGKSIFIALLVAHSISKSPRRNSHQWAHRGPQILFTRQHLQATTVFHSSISVLLVRFHIETTLEIKGGSQFRLYKAIMEGQERDQSIHLPLIATLEYNLITDWQGMVLWIHNPIMLWKIAFWEVSHTIKMS